MFQVLFHPPHWGTFHLSLTVLVHYRSPNLFSLGRWSSQIQAGFHVSDPTQEHPRILSKFILRDYYPLWWSFPDSFKYKDKFHVGVLQPSAEAEFGLFPVRSPLLRESHLISFPWLLRCFSSPGVLSPTYEFSWGSPIITSEGFTHSEISGSMPV